MVYCMHILNWPVITSSEQASEYLAKGASGVIVCADEDGEWHKQLSPRFHSGNITERSASFSALLDDLNAQHIPFAVALTVEELCPGGLDPTDGIWLAQLCETKGAVAIIASGGTQDFPALKYRRPTQIKDTNAFFSHNEPWLSSALWLVGKVQIPIIAKGTPCKNEEAQVIAQRLGITAIQKI